MTEDEKENERAIVRLTNRGLTTRSATLVHRGLEQSAILSPTVGTIWTNSIGMELVYIPPGEFMMGSSEAEIDEAVYETKKFIDLANRDWFSMELPKHKVAIRDGFWMGRYQVTQGQWQSVMGDNPSRFKEDGTNRPVENVSWDDIQIFLERLNGKNDEFQHDLPSEAQWEYAARARTTTAFAFGDSLNSSQANFDGNRPYASTKGIYIEETVSVGQYQPNAWGLYDMHGNVWEWCRDWYDENYYVESPSSDPTGPGSGEKRVKRGGSWFEVAYLARSAARSLAYPTNFYGIVGFRVVARPRTPSSTSLEKAKELLEATKMPPKMLKFWLKVNQRTLQKAKPPRSTE